MYHFPKRKCIESFGQIEMALIRGVQGWQGQRSGEHTSLPPIWPGFNSEIWGPFLESPETFRAHLGLHNSLYIFKAKASRGTKLCINFNFYSLYNI